MKKKILIVVGTRPNFIKVTQFKKEAAHFPGIEIRIVHTGQHFDAQMADVFFEQFALQPDYFLNISQGSANQQMSQIMTRLEELIAATFKPDLVMVVGDVNSTFAAALTAKKLNIRIAHLESGLRSFDKSMPEEDNRVLTDAITDLFFVTEQSGIDNLLNEKVPAEKIFFVGNTMIDTLVAYKEKIMASDILEKLKIVKGNYVLMTMHRPATVDDRAGLLELIGLIEDVTSSEKLVFPVHPRTLKNITAQGLISHFERNKNLVTTPPLDYFAFQKLAASCHYILTDSGGIQEESTHLGVPCLTLRPNTERPVTCSIGTNTLVPFDRAVIGKNIADIKSGRYKKGVNPPLWDGRSTFRILEIINSLP
ncbi:MAG: non-hydrolyzing UDP-N-acetylglucosamine 2-epimerase [Bacteroidia bacterium]